MQQDIRPAFQFFAEQAGGIVGRRAEGALELARAEAGLRQAVENGRARVVWEWDELEAIVPDGMTDEEYAGKFESNEWSGPYWARIEVGGEAVASLGGIVLADGSTFNRYGTRDDGSTGWTSDPYARVIEAELALEALDDLLGPIAGRRDVAPLLANVIGQAALGL